MRYHRLISCALLGILLVLTANCTNTSAAIDTSTAIPAIHTSPPSPTATQIPTDAPTPEPDFSFLSLAVIEQDDSERTSVIGFLRNDMMEGVTNIHIRVRLIDESRAVVSETEEALPVKHLLPREIAPFQISFADSIQTVQIEAEVVRYQRSGYKDAELKLEISGTVYSAQGRTTVLGWISNPLQTPAQISNFTLTAINPEGIPQALAETHHPSSLLPGQRVPFHAFFLRDLQSSSLQGRIDATQLPELETPPFTFQQGPELTFDPQGNLLVRGIVQNEGRLTRWISGTMALMLNEYIVSLTSFNHPSPLHMQEERAFGLTEFPAWQDRLRELDGEVDDLTVRFFLDPLGSTEFYGQILQLRCDVIGFESTGSSLILHGTVQNPTRNRVDLPSVQADIRSTEGFLLTAGWVTVAQSLEVEESSSFVLVLRLPDGMLLSQSEIDVYATGILEGIGLPF